MDIDGNQPKEEYSPILQSPKLEHQDDQSDVKTGEDVSMQSSDPPLSTSLTLSDVLDGKADSLLQVPDQPPKLSSIEGYNSGSEGKESDIDDDNHWIENLPLKEGFCIECDDVPAAGKCVECDDAYCQVCYHHQHRKGNRKKHALKLFPWVDLGMKTNSSNDISGKNGSVVGLSSLTAVISGAIAAKPPKARGLPFFNLRPKNSAPDSDDEIDDQPEYLTPAPTTVRQTLASSEEYLDRSKYIPLRLEYEERRYVRLISAALDISEYTDKIDVIIYANKPKRIVAQIKELCQILSGLVVAADYKTGQALFQDKNFAQNAIFYQRVFELGRRHKVMNPDKMRSSYGKLLYMLMDSQIPEITEMLEFNCVIPMVTVYNTLESKQALNVLSDELIPIATQEIVSDGKSRAQVQAEIKKKEKALDHLSRKYANADALPEIIKQCLYSIGDNNSFLRQNRDPCDKMLHYLTKYFSPHKIDKQYSLGITAGKGGARLTHDHTRQYHYVFQSLTLWSMVLNDFYKLWIFAESDLLDTAKGNIYKLRDTGQGLNRVQSSARVSRMMHIILSQAQKKVATWVGSSVVHLGDHNVPNAFMFIDKYTQISRILGPVVLTLDKIGEIFKEPSLRKYIENQWGSIEDCRKTILTDFFRHAFDGSGSDNWFDAGSCIDGRLTSAWNWCSKIESKAYFPVFLLTSFTGFDGEMS